MFKMLLSTMLFVAAGFFGTVQAGDFDWLKSLSVEAKSDESGFKTKLAARFQVGNVKINAVVGDVGGNYADAYMVLRLAEMSRQKVETVVEQYQANRDRGWGVLAKSLGIKPGSRQFHALKRGHDLQASAGSMSKSKGGKPGKSPGKGKSR